MVMSATAQVQSLGPLHFIGEAAASFDRGSFDLDSFITYVKQCLTLIHLTKIQVCETTVTVMVRVGISLSLPYSIFFLYIP